MKKEFVEILKEEAETFDSISAKIQKAIRKHFPDSYLYVQASDLGPNRSMGVTFAIGKDKSEWANGIIQNDPAWLNFWIHDAFDKKTNAVVKDLKLNSNSAGSYYTQKSGRVKVGWRDIKKPATADKIVKAVDDYFGKLKKVHDENS